MKKPLIRSTSGRDMTEAELEAIAWLAMRLGWQTVHASERSHKQYDMDVNGMWFMRECLVEFWRMGYFSEKRVGEEAYIRELPATTVRIEFDMVVAKAKKQPMFTPEFISAMFATWQEVSPDAGRCTNAEAIELVLDADRLETLGGYSYDELDWLEARFGQPMVWKALAQEVRLV